MPISARLSIAAAWIVYAASQLWAQAGLDSGPIRHVAAGAFVYVEGPMNVTDLARLLVRAGAVRGMVLDMNPLWPIFATYTPASPTGYASAGNGRDLTSSMLQTPARFFAPAYSRDFITLSSR